MAIKFNESAAALKEARDNSTAKSSVRKTGNPASASTKPVADKPPADATKFVNEAGVPLSFNLPDKKHILLPGEEIVFNPSPMSKKEMDGVVKKREQRKEYKRERSVELMRELREAKRLGINVADYRKQLKGE